MKTFPVDIWSVKEYGVKEWHKEFFWPVSTEEFQNLSHEIDELYLGILSESPPDMKDIFWVLYGWVGGIAMLFHALLVIHRLKQKGFSICYHPSSIYYKPLIEEGIVQKIMTKPMPQVPSYGQRIRGGLKAWLGNVLCHGLDLGYYFNRSLRPHYLFVEYYNRKPFTIFAESCGKKATFIYPTQLMPKRLKHTDKLPGVRQSVARFIQGFETIATRYEIRVEKRQLEGLSNLLLDSLQYVADYIQEISQILHRRKRVSILLQGLGDIFKRSLCVAGRKEGYPIVGFTHGNYMGIFNNSSVPHVLLSMVDTFVVPTKGSAELFSIAKEKFLHPYGKDVEIIPSKSGESDEYGRIKRLTRVKTPPSSIKKVMLLEYPLNEWWYRGGSYGAFWPYQLDLSLNIATLMRRHGIKTILKRHPDRLRESEGIYDRYFDELLTTSFEEVYDKADAYIFPNIGTTTFGFSLLTNKTIIMFESELKDIWEPVREFLKKRCRVVPSWLAEDGRLMFDEDKLVDAIIEPPEEEPNDEFIERYMLS